MPEGRSRAARRRAVFTIPTNRSFADSLVAGMIARHGRDPLALASGRILLPNNRAVRSITDAFVRASGSGLVLPAADPDRRSRARGADRRSARPGHLDEAVPPAVEPLRAAAGARRAGSRDGESALEALRLAADLARTLDSLLVEEVDPQGLPTQWRRARACPALADVARRLGAILDQWPGGFASLAGWIWPSAATCCFARAAERWASSRRRASPSLPGSPPLRRQSRR
jgi:ATP-dependent helicase/nuclease subunit B